MPYLRKQQQEDPLPQPKFKNSLLAHLLAIVVPFIIVLLGIFADKIEDLILFLMKQ